VFKSRIEENAEENERGIRTLNASTHLNQVDSIACIVIQSQQRSVDRQHERLINDDAAQVCRFGIVVFRGYLLVNRNDLSFGAYEIPNCCDCSEASSQSVMLSCDSHNVRFGSMKKRSLGIAISKQHGANTNFQPNMRCHGAT